MLLAVDVGNTNITFGVYDGEREVSTFRMMSLLSRTSDEFGITILALLERNGIKKDDIEGIIVVSVVPGIMHALIGGLTRYVGKRPYIVGFGVDTGIEIKTDNPKEVGTDRIVDAAGAYALYGGPLLVLDFGTATTYDMVDEKGAFVAGVTAPGIGISAKALWQNTAKLPEIEIKKPASILAKETISSMQAGLVYGQIGQTKYMIEEMRREAGIPDMKVVATGGLGRMISEEVKEIDIYDATLTLKGLQIIYERNRGRAPQENPYETGRE
ncbi:MAG: type III pantothenate kinase [Lachnospiraceae bacterium]|nr:type III pantothenate kinase [Lachnospiraceae bacterium]